MDSEKTFDGLMLFAAVVYFLVLIGYIEIAAVVYLLFLIIWLAQALYKGFKIGQIERREYKTREKNWKKEVIRKTMNKQKKFDRAVPATG